MNKDFYFKNVENAITQNGYYLATVLAGPQPNFVYTIGLVNILGFEIAFCGGANYTIKEHAEIVAGVYSEIVNQSNSILSIKVNDFGIFTLAEMHDSWSQRILLGVYDYFKIDNLKALQILPDLDNRLLDIPLMSMEWSIDDPIWKWLEVDWNYGVPSRSKVITNYSSLKGEVITELTRWEQDEWEMFVGVGPDVEEKDIRIAPLGTVLGIDKTIEPALYLDIGKGLWRDSITSEWHDWG